MRKNFTVRRNPLSFYFLLVIGLLLATTPATSAEEKLLTVEKVEGELALRNSIKLGMKNLPDWLSKQSGGLSKLILYIDGEAFKDRKPALIGSDTLLFDLRRTEKNKDAWTNILCRKGESFFHRTVRVTVGTENGDQMPSNANSEQLIRVDESWFYAFAVAGFLLVLLFLRLAMRSDIIRDSGPPPKEPDRKTYSLARTQMALWFFTIIIGYVFIWMVTSDLSSLTPGILGLMGISAATGLGSAVVDSNKESEQKNQRRMLDEKKKSDEIEAEKLNSQITALKVAIDAIPTAANLDEQKAALAAKQAELSAKKKEIAQADEKIDKLNREAKPPVSKSFTKDILNDDNGVSFHRFQIFVWTIVLISIFIGRVIDTLTMPTFDATLLALMGISSGTYIGFKLPDKQG